MKISQSIYGSIRNFLTKFFGEQGNSSGRRRNIAECFAVTLGKIVGKFCEFKISPKQQH